jgi:hypothetical protein
MNSLKLGRPLEVTCYRYDSPKQIDEITDRTKFITPSPVYPVVSKILSGKAASMDSCDFHLKDATRILMETPILGWFLTYESGMWNQDVLNGERSEVVEIFDRTACSRSEPVSLTNVFIEFSPLENTDWHRLRQLDSDVQPLRALWLVSQENRFRLHLFPQKVNAQEAPLHAAGPFEYVFDGRSGVFWRRNPGATAHQKANWDTTSDKAFFVALTILRFLSPTVKIDPAPIKQTICDDGTHVITIPIRQASARLMRVMEAKSDRHWYVPRDVQTNEPFFFTSSMACLDVLQFESMVPWPHVDAAKIRRLINEHFETKLRGCS